MESIWNDYFSKRGKWNPFRAIIFLRALPEIYLACCSSNLIENPSIGTLFAWFKRKNMAMTLPTNDDQLIYPPPHSAPSRLHGLAAIQLGGVSFAVVERGSVSLEKRNVPPLALRF